MVPSLLAPPIFLTYKVEGTLRGGEEGRSDKGITDVRGGPLTRQQKRVDQKKHAL